MNRRAFLKDLLAGTAACALGAAPRQLGEGLLEEPSVAHQIAQLDSKLRYKASEYADVTHWEAEGRKKLRQLFRRVQLEQERLLSPGPGRGVFDNFGGDETYGGKK